ncbi:MAG: YiiD C-terminal domain-containing protein [Pseudomonadales bacterium]|nr:YiiD C-terminal domain-containing protein [Pseudomonadales bacterium]
MQLDRLIADLEATWYEKIPITKAMQAKVRAFDGNTLVVEAALGPNINLHGTAFAGSLYTVCALTGWSMVHLQTTMRSLEGSIVLASGHIDYLKPVQEDLVAVCTFGDQEASFARLLETGKARFPQTATMAANGVEAAIFKGEYAFLRRAH